MTGFTGTSGHQNRLMSPSFYACLVHGNHEAETFVKFDTSEGQEASPVCRAAVPLLIASLDGATGIRTVYKTPVDAYQGVIYGMAFLES